MGRTEKIIAVIGVFNLLFFLGFSLVVYESRMKADSLSTQLELLKEESISNRFQSLDSDSIIAHNLEYQSSVLETIEKRTSVIEESIEPENKRWALIKRVRPILERYARPKMNIVEYTTVASAIVQYSEDNDVPIALVLAVARRESAFNPKIESHAGAKGIMQVMPATASDIAGEIGKRHYNLYNAKHNIQLGTYYLWKMTDRFHGDVELAIKAYNCGPSYVEKIEAGIYKNYPEETIEYEKYVLKYKKEFEEMGL